MTGSVFVDTNVLVYERDAYAADKQARAHLWLAHLWETRSGRISFQVLNEFYWTVTQKLVPGMDRESARRDVRALMAWQPVPIGSPMLERSWVIQERHQLAFWDALIVAAALEAECRYLLTEDLQHGQQLGDLRVMSPFESNPEDLD